MALFSCLVPRDASHIDYFHGCDKSCSPFCIELLSTKLECEALSTGPISWCSFFCYILNYITIWLSWWMCDFQPFLLFLFLFPVCFLYDARVSSFKNINFMLTLMYKHNWFNSEIYGLKSLFLSHADCLGCRLGLSFLVELMLLG